MHTLLLGTGGTIAGLSQPSPHVNHAAYTAAQLSIKDLAHSLPELARALKNGQLVCEDLAQVDSKDMDGTVWYRLAQRVAEGLADSLVSGILITHGSDTLEETACFLQILFGQAATRKPIVLTCAMRPFDHPAADGPGNLRLAFQVAQEAQKEHIQQAPQKPGVQVVCAGQIYPALGLQKLHPARLDPFVNTFTLNTIPNQPILPCPFTPDKALEAIGKTGFIWPWVETLTSGTLARADSVEAWAGQGIQGLVVATTGNGTLHHHLEAALQKAQNKGIAVWLSTRCVLGSLQESSQGMFKTTPLPPIQARVALVLALAQLQASSAL